MSNIQNDPIINLGISYINGLNISRDLVTPNTKLNISAGMCRDSNNVMDITLGIFNPNLEGNVVAAPLVLNTAINGVNGLDTGSLVANGFYAIYIIDDSSYYKKTACILTLASNSMPLIPYGYDSSRLIGYWATDGSAHFYAGYMSGNSNDRYFAYDSMKSLTTITSATYTPFYFNLLCPSVPGTIAKIFVDFSAVAAGNVLSAAFLNVITGPIYRLIAPVALGVAVTTGEFDLMLTVNDAAGGSIKSTAGAVALSIVGYQFFI